MENHVKRAGSFQEMFSTSEKETKKQCEVIKQLIGITEEWIVKTEECLTKTKEGLECSEERFEERLQEIKTINKPKQLIVNTVEMKLQTPLLSASWSNSTPTFVGKTLW